MSVNFDRYKRKVCAVDDFNRANGNLGAPNWTQANTFWGNVTITNNEVHGSGSNTSPTQNPFAVWTGSPVGENQYSEIRVSTLPFQSNSHHIGVVVRGSLDNNPNEDMYWAFIDADAAGPLYGTRFGKTVNGVDTTFTDTPIAWSVGDRIGLEAVGNKLRVTRNGESLGDDFYREDNSLASGYPGIIGATNSAATRGDSWFAGKMVSIAELGSTIIKKPWTRQPPPGTKIDWNNPLVRGLSVFITPVGNQFVDIVSSAQSVLTSGDASEVIHADGMRGVRLPGGTTDTLLTLTLPRTVTLTDKTTIALCARIDDQSITKPTHDIFRVANGANNRYARIGIRPHTDANLRHFEGEVKPAGLSYYNNVSATASEYTYDTVGIGICDFDFTNEESYLLHPNKYTSNQTGSGLDSDNSELTQVRIRNDFTTDGLNTDVFFGAFWSGRILTAAEKNSFQDNPWQIFEPEKIHIPGKVANRKLVVF